MRASTIVLALAGSVTALQSTLVPVQQIGDGQIQNPVTAPPAPATSAPAPPAPPAPVTSASGAAPPAPVTSASGPAPSAPVTSAGAPPAKGSAPAPPPPAPPATSAAGPPSPPSYGNTTATVTGRKTLTSSVVKPSTPATSASPSKPVVQTGAANSMVGSTAGLGFVAFLAALLG